MSENIFFAGFFFPAAAVVLVFFMKYVSSVLQARARLGHDAAYRELTSKAVTAQAETAAALASLGASLSEVQARLVTVENILKAVE